MLLYEQIQTNKVKTVFLVLGFIVFVIVVGGAVSYMLNGDWLFGGITAGGVALVYTLIMIASSTEVLMRMNHAREIKSSQDNPFLWHTVENLAMVARIPRPRIFIINDPSPNAFATGITPKKGAVAVTQGLLDRLNREEVEGVIAHEVAHIKNYDIRLATIAIALVSVIALISDIGTRMVFYSRGGRNNRQHPIVLVIAIIFLIISPLVAILIQMAISRNREYLADASGAELTRNPHALASALHKISGVKEPVREASSSTAMMYFANPLKKKMAGMFSTHPPSEERIRRLREM